MHRVDPKLITGSTVIASDDGKKNGTFWNSWMIPYFIIKFYGMISGENAKHTNMTEEDVQKILDAMWDGTLNKVSRSKLGQIPLLLIRVVYNTDDFFIGNLERFLTLDCKKEEEEIRDVEDVEFKFEELFNTLVKHKDKIDRVEVRTNLSEFIEGLEKHDIPYKLI